MRLIRAALGAALVALGLVAPATAQAQRSTISGRVTAAGTNEPLADSRVMVVGSSMATTTNAEGRYTLTNVPNGPFEVRVIRVGFQEQKKSVTITAGTSATLDFSLGQAIVKLQEVVTTATGEQRKVELGNTVAVIEASKRVEETPIHSMNDLLVAKAPGVNVLPNAMTGSGAQIRIRGLNSVTRSNEPIYIIDGVRMDGSAGGLSTGGTSPSRLNDITPEEIENIEVVKGPSAATLYGTSAANGVIVITTKKGKAGNTRWTWTAESGIVQDKNTYPKTYAEWGHLTTGTAAQQAQLARCLNVTLADKTCKLDSTTTAYLVRDPATSPIGEGKRNLYNMQVSGGSDAVKYFVSGNLENEFGPIRMPGADINFLDSTKVGVRGEWMNPEAIQRESFRANLSGAFSPKLDMQVSSAFTKSDQRLPQVDNNVNSFYYNAYTNPGHTYAVTGSNGLNYNPISTIGEPLRGWAQFTPADIFQRLQSATIQRFIGSANAAYRPLAWLQVDGTTGVDFYSENTFRLQRLNEGPDFSTQRLGNTADNRGLNRLFTATVRSTATWNANSNFNLRTTVGADYLNNEGEASNASATQLAPGGQTVGSGAVKDASNTLPTATKTLGYYAQEQVGWRDRLFVTAALRYDQNTAFGTQYKGVPYPKFSASYNISDESFFPHWDQLNSLHLRLAYGQSGVQPGATSALRTFATTTTNIVVDRTGLLASAIGNPNLKPETSAEWETGFDTRLLNNRINLEFTYYSKQTKDALLNDNIATSAGASAGSILRNLGSVKNAGAELQVNAQIVDRRSFAWDVTLGGSHNKNKLVTLGKSLSGNDIPRSGTTTRTQAGYPLNSYFVVPYTWADDNGDGLISVSEVHVSTTDTTFMGPSIPADQFTVQNGFDLFQRQLRLSALVDHKGGGVIFNQYNFLCTQTQSCQAKSDPNAPLWDQARSVAANNTTPRTNFGYYENGQFWRLREVSATWNIPARYLSRLRGRDASLTFGARNLKVWTNYSGEDPESNYSQGDIQNTLLTTAPRRYYTVRLNLHY